MKWIIKKLKSEKGIFGLFRKTPKPNLTPDVSRPKQSQLFFTKPFRTLASQGIQAATTGQETPGIGFGEDFVRRATNPVIQARLDRLRGEEIPELTAAQSARGITRSSIATEQIRKSSRQAQGDIDQLLANFFVLNEKQKKSDIQDRVNLGVGLQNQEAQMLDREAAASEALADKTAAQQFARHQAEADRINKLSAIGFSAAAPFLGATPALQSAFLSVGGSVGPQSSLEQLLAAGTNPGQTQTS